MLRAALLTSLLSLVAVPAAEAMIQVDRGIAGVRLGNTRSEVRAALGRPKSIRTGTNDFGPFVQYRFTGGIRVIFQGRTHVSLVSTTGLGDRTGRGVGVGSSEQRVKDNIANITCQTFEGTRVCQNKQGLAGQRITVFFLESGKVTRVDVGRVID